MGKRIKIYTIWTTVDTGSISDGCEQNIPMQTQNDCAVAAGARTRLYGCTVSVTSATHRNESLASFTLGRFK